MWRGVKRNLKFLVAAIVILMIGTSFTYMLPHGQGLGVQPTAVSSDANNYNLNATFTWGRTSFVDYLNPFNTHFMTTQTVMELVYPALCYWSANMSVLEPYLATSWDINLANHTAIFNLTHNAVWSDGAPMNAQDVVWSFNEYKQPFTHEHNWFSTVTSTTAIDNYTVMIKFTGLPFLYIALPQVIVPMHVWSKISNVENYSGFNGSSFVGGGPFLMANYSPNAELELVRNANFWNTTYSAHFAKLIVKAYTSDSTLLAGLKSGEVSEAYIGATILSSVQNDTNLVVHTAHSTVDYALEYNQYANGTGNPALRNLSFRKAMGYALNISELIQLGEKGYATATVGWVPPGNPYYSPYLSPWPYDPVKAGQLLNNSSYKLNSNGYRTYPGNTTVVSLVFSINSADSLFTVLAPTMVQMWKAIGIKVTTTASDAATLDNMAMHYSFDMMVGDWFSDANYASELYVMTGSQIGLEPNAAGYNNTTYNNAYVSMNAATSVQQAKYYAFEMQNLTYNNATFTPLWCPDSMIAYQSTVVNVPYQYAGMVPQYGYGWWILLNPYILGSSSTTTTTTSSNTTTYIIAAVVVAVIAIGAGVGLYSRSRKKN